MHSPTLITFGAMLIALVSCVLFAVWRFNKHIPGLQMWALSYGVGLVPILGLLWRERSGTLIRHALCSSLPKWSQCGPVWAWHSTPRPRSSRISL